MYRPAPPPKPLSPPKLQSPSIAKKINKLVPPPPASFMKKKKERFDEATRRFRAAKIKLELAIKELEEASNNLDNICKQF